MAQVDASDIWAVSSSGLQQCMEIKNVLGNAVTRERHEIQAKLVATPKTYMPESFLDSVGR